jgi:antitoxin VapB
MFDAMRQSAKIFMSGRSQAVRLPLSYRFEGDEVFIRRDPDTGDVILSAKPRSWGPFIDSLQDTDAPEDFMADRDQGVQPRNPFSDYKA